VAATHMAHITYSILHGIRDAGGHKRCLQWLFYQRMHERSIGGTLRVSCKKATLAIWLPLAEGKNSGWGRYKIPGPFTSIPFSIIFSSSTFGEISNASARLTNSWVMNL
jgi:hypothetical protein